MHLNSICPTNSSNQPISNFCTLQFVITLNPILIPYAYNPKFIKLPSKAYINIQLCQEIILASSHNHRTPNTSRKHQKHIKHAIPVFSKEPPGGSS